jgi:hypothetical protein
MSSDEVRDLMEQLERRVAEKRAAGVYSVDALANRRASGSEPYLVDDLIEVSRLAEVTPDLELAASTKPGAVGKAFGKAKHGLTRATSQPLLDLADRSTAFNTALLAYITELAQEIVALRAEVDRLREE